MLKSKNKNDVVADKPKKPFYKKWWFWVIVAVVVIAAVGGSGGKDAEQPEDPTSATVTDGSMSAAGPADISAEAPGEVDGESDDSDGDDAADALDFNVNFFNEFHNDSTGRWRKALVATGDQIQDYALDYYNAYFKSDDEVHVIYNFSLNTVNCLTVLGDVLNVSITDYIDGEEHDANIACGGTSLGNYHINIDTGEIVWSSFDE